MGKIFTVGHSNKSIEQLVALLRRNRITHVVDARTYPVSRYAPQFNRFPLQKVLARHGISYIWRGQSMGGLGINVGQAEAIAGLAESAKNGVRIAIMCSEADYHDCHRYSVLAPLFEAQEVPVEHLLWNGESAAHRSAQEKLF